jgi:hypothetical protein
LAGLIALALMAAGTGIARAQESPALDAVLYPTEIEPLASGSAEWQGWDFEIRPPRRPFLYVEVQGIDSTESVQVLIHPPESEDYRLVGVIQLTDGSGQLGRTNWYVNPGDEILVVDEATDALLLWGVFE